MAISLRPNEEEDALFKKYAQLNNLSERIEDEFDLKAYETAMEEFRKNPVTYSFDEIERELGLV